MSTLTTGLEPIDASEDNSQFLGRAAENTIRSWFIGHGYAVVSQPRSSPFDLLVNGKRVEVKVGRPDSKGNWGFNIHRHGVLDESQVDIYVLRFERIPWSEFAIHLIVPAPVKVMVLNISFRSLLTRWGKHFNNFSLLGEPNGGRK